MWSNSSCKLIFLLLDIDAVAGALGGDAGVRLVHHDVEGVGVAGGGVGHLGGAALGGGQQGGRLGDVPAGPPGGGGWSPGGGGRRPADHHHHHHHHHHYHHHHHHHHLIISSCTATRSQRGWNPKQRARRDKIIITYRGPINSNIVHCTLHPLLILKHYLITKVLQSGVENC